MTQLAQALGTVIRDLRKARQLSQEDLSFQSGVDRSFLSHFERGRQQPSLETLFKLAQGLKTPAAKILAMVEGNPDELLETASSGLPPAYLEKLERELRAISASGETATAVAYVKYKVIESYLLGMKSQYANWKPSKETP